MILKSWLILQILFFSFVFSTVDNPYNVLEIRRDATHEEIRKQYKKLVKEWHPDKSRIQNAEEKFIEIKKAYELLSDPERKKIFDNYGVTNEDSNLLRNNHKYNVFQDFANPFEGDISVLHKMSITSKYFEQFVIPKSKQYPYIIIFYSNFCFKCNHIAATIESLQEKLEPLGIRFATINAGHESHMLRKFNLNDIPSLALIINKNHYFYKGSLIKLQNITDFIRRKMPYQVMSKINDGNFNDFLNGWIDNKVRVLFLQPNERPRLRYLLAAYFFRDRASFGYVDVSLQNSKELQLKFRINSIVDSMLIFNENSSQPITNISMNSIPVGTINNIIKSNQYLTLPRLSSQEFLEALCPAEWNRPKKKLCVVLVIENADNNFALHYLRQIALRSPYNIDKVRYTYILKDKQSVFMQSLYSESETGKSLNIVIIWRRDTSRINYEWVEDIKLEPVNSRNSTDETVIREAKQKLDQLLNRLLQTSESLNSEAFVTTLLDEHAQGLFGNIFNKVYIMIEYIYDNLENEHLWALASVFGTLAFILIVGFLMAYFVRVEEENLKKNGNLGNNKCTSISTKHAPELKLHELRVEKYNGLIRLLKPGCRTIILITDMKTRQKLIPHFHKAVWPYRKNKTLMFGHMLIEKGLSWYTELLRLSLSEPRNLNINAKNCIGTVIALNGHRKYFCVYHAKHPDSRMDKKRMLNMTDDLVKNYDEEAPKISNDKSILWEDTLLEGFSNWLDRLFEGMTDRYFINYWPDFHTK